MASYSLQHTGPQFWGPVSILDEFVPRDLRPKFNAKAESLTFMHKIGVSVPSQILN